MRHTHVIYPGSFAEISTFFFQSLTCSLIETFKLGDVVAVYETKEVGEYERQLTATLFFCQITELTDIPCECFLNRTVAGGNQLTMTLWSARLLSNTTLSPSMMPQRKMIINAPQCALITACIDQ